MTIKTSDLHTNHFLGLEKETFRENSIIRKPKIFKNLKLDHLKLRQH